MNPRNVRLCRAAAIAITGTRGPELTHVSLTAVAELVHVEERRRTSFCR